MKLRFILLMIYFLGLAGCQESQTIDEMVDEKAAYHVEVVVDGSSISHIDIHSFAEGDYRTVISGDVSRHALTISQIIQKAGNVSADALDAYLEGYQCDYESADGFRSSSKGDRCPMVSCKLAVFSHIDTRTHQLFYDDNQPMASLGCYNVTDLKKILMYAIETDN